MKIHTQTERILKVLVRYRCLSLLLLFAILTIIPCYGTTELSDFSDTSVATTYTDNELLQKFLAYTHLYLDTNAPYKKTVMNRLKAKYEPITEDDYQLIFDVSLLDNIIEIMKKMPHKLSCSHEIIHYLALIVDSIPPHAHDTLQEQKRQLLYIFETNDIFTLE